MTDTNSDELKRLQAKLESIYQEGAHINEMGDHVELNDQVRPYLSLDKIEEWVDSLPPETVVGFTVAITDCPVHRYLKDCGFNPTLVTCGSIRGEGFVFNSSRNCELDEKMPKAVTELILLVDQQGIGGTPVTAQTLKGLVQRIQRAAEAIKNNQTESSSAEAEFEELVSYKLGTPEIATDPVEFRNWMRTRLKELDAKLAGAHAPRLSEREVAEITADPDNFHRWMQAKRKELRDNRQY